MVMPLRASRPRSFGAHALQALLISAGALLPAVADADDTLDQFASTLEQQDDDSSVFFRSVFGARKTIAHGPVPEQTAAVPNPSVVFLAEVDPNFDRWQRDANEHLKQEHARNAPKLHPLAAAHPTKSVVVCEAGCGKSTADQIVYIAPVVPAVLMTASSDADGPPEPAAANLGDGELACVAGCYVRTSIETGRRQVGENHDGLGAHETSIVLTATSQRSQAGQNGGIVDVQRAPRKITEIPATEFYDGWRMKIVFPRAAHRDLIGRAWQRQGVRHDRIIVSENPDEVR